MFGFWLIVFVLTIVGVAWRYYNKGIKVSGHVCSNVPVVPGARYKPEIVRQVTVYCKDCHELIPSQVTVIEKTNLPFPFVAELSPVDYEIHQKIFHDKVDKEPA